MARAATTAAGPFTAALDALRVELEQHRREAVEVEALIARLEKYAANGAAPPAPPSVKRRPGRPPLGKDAETLRTKRRDAMRRHRAKLKAENAAAKVFAAIQTQAARQKVEAPVEQKKKTEPAVASAAANGHGKKCKRNSPVVSGETGKLTEWETGTDGTLSRPLVAPGEHTPLKDERPPA